ncbi:cytochrome c oxidase assembly factor 6 homolog [Brachyhypopomus gauderio]|uniref:cytochrome c oxidase assembly factor 6 homolog n=1 Tax=Brachyhypopomus gauderio TaxID=698409 RepID=UPI004041E947
MSAPNSEQRRACWGARDALWTCLDHLDHQNHQDHSTACEAYRKLFEANCPAQWVKYFNKRRDFLKYKEKLENKGFEPAAGATKL